VELAMEALWWKHVGVRGSLTVMDPRDLTQDRILAYRYRVVSLVTPFLRWGPVEVEADYRYANRLDEVEVYPYDQRVPQKVVNLRLRYRLGILTLIASVNNLFNYNYTVIERNMGEIRNASLSVFFEF